MLPFNLLVMCLYAVFSLIVQLFMMKDQTPIYDQLDWITNTSQAFINFFIIIGIQIVVFAL